MSARNQGRVRQPRKERPFKERHRDTSNDSTRSTGSSRNESRGGDAAKNRKHRDNKTDEPSNRSRDRIYESTGKATSDVKERTKPDTGRRPDKGLHREKASALTQGRDGYRDLPKGKMRV